MPRTTSQTPGLFDGLTRQQVEAFLIQATGSLRLPRFPGEVEISLRGNPSGRVKTKIKIAKGTPWGRFSIDCTSMWDVHTSLRESVEGMISAARAANR